MDPLCAYGRESKRQVSPTSTSPVKSSEIHTLGDHWASVVVGHNMLRTNHHVVSSLDSFALWQVDGILLHDLLDDSLRDAGRACGCSECPPSDPAWPAKHRGQDSHGCETATVPPWFHLRRRAGGRRSREQDAGRGQRPRAQSQIRRPGFVNLMSDMSRFDPSHQLGWTGARAMFGREWTPRLRCSKPASSSTSGIQHRFCKIRHSLTQGS